MTKEEYFNITEGPYLSKEFHFGDFKLCLSYKWPEKETGQIKLIERKLFKGGFVRSVASEYSSLKMLQIIFESSECHATRAQLDIHLGVANLGQNKRFLLDALETTETGEDYIISDKKGGYLLNRSVAITRKTVKDCESQTLQEQIAQYNANDFAQKYPAYVKQILDNCPRLSVGEKSDRWKGSEFRIALSKITLRKEGGRIFAKVEIPNDPFVAFTKEQRRCMEYAHKDNRTPYPAFSEIKQFLDMTEDCQLDPLLMRMSAGGCIAILSCPIGEAYERVQKKGNREQLLPKDYQDYVILTQKDAGSPSYAYDLSPASGIAEKEADWTNPLLVVVGEFAEEIRIIERTPIAHKNPGWHFPAYSEAGLRRRERAVRDLRKEYVALYRQHWLEEIIGYPDEHKHTFYPIYETEIIPLGKDKLNIKYASGDEESFEGYLVIDPQVGALDLMMAIRMKIDIPLSKLSIMDGEATLTKTPSEIRDTLRMKLLNRNIFAFKPSQLRRLFEGKNSKASFFGRNPDAGDRWTENVEVELGTDWLISYPGYFAGIALLKNVLKCEDFVPSKSMLSKNEDREAPTLTFSE